ncbi:MAG: YciC family protein [Solirubrobacterales bacterium]
MTTASGSPGKLDIGGVFEATTEIYKRSFGTVWIVALILLVPSAIIVGLLGNGGIMGFIGSLVQLVATAWLVGSVVRIVQDVEEDGSVDWGVGEILGSVTPKLIAIILLQIVTGVLTVIGLFIFIVPGIILALMWAVAMPSLIVENKGVFDSMTRSSELTKDNRMRILGVGLVILAAYLVLAIVGGVLVAATPIVGVIALIILGVLIYPYISIIAAVLYYRLVELKEGVVTGGAIEETVVVEEAVVDPGTPPPAV